MSTLRFGEAGYLQASGTRDAFGALSDDLVADGLPAILVNYGDREYADEVRVFLDRYRLQATGNGRFGDVRVWEGRRYVRVSAAGTVAVPGSSNHGKRRSGDLAYPYNSDTAAHRRAKVLAKRHNITCEGEGFAEKWHWTFWGALGVIGNPAAVSGSKPLTLPKRRRNTMVHAAWRDDNGTIAVQMRPKGKITPLENPFDWAGIAAGSGAQAAQVSNAQLQALFDQYGTTKYPDFDNGAGGTLPLIVYVRDGDGTVYLYEAGKLEALVDPTTLVALHSQHAQSITLSKAEVTNLLSAS